MTVAYPALPGSLVPGSGVETSSFPWCCERQTVIGVFGMSFLPAALGSLEKDIRPLTAHNMYSPFFAFERRRQKLGRCRYSAYWPCRWWSSGPEGKPFLASFCSSGAGRMMTKKCVGVLLAPGCRHRDSLKMCRSMCTRAQTNKTYTPS